MAHLHTERTYVDAVAGLLRGLVNPRAPSEVKTDGDNLPHLGLCHFCHGLVTHKLQHEHVLMRIVADACVSITAGYVKVDVPLDIGLSAIGRIHLVRVTNPLDDSCYLIECHITLD